MANATPTRYSVLLIPAPILLLRPFSLCLSLFLSIPFSLSFSGTLSALDVAIL